MKKAVEDISINEKSVRKPKQTRSIETKNKILNTALELFCKKGFYVTTTNEIAKVAHVPIGSLYSYYKNKDTILLEILDLYNKSFITKVYDAISCSPVIKEKQNMNERKDLIKNIINTLIDLHSESKELNLELKALSHTRPDVARITHEHDYNIFSLILNELKNNDEFISLTDFEASAMVIQDIICSVVDRIVFKENSIDNDRIIDAAVTAICKFLS